MKKSINIFLALFFGCIVLNAQENYVIHYNYTSQRDSLKPHQRLTETMNLYIGNQSTLYAAQNRIGMDSLVLYNKASQGLDSFKTDGQLDMKQLMQGLPKTIYSFYIWKAIGEQESHTMAFSLLGDFYTYQRVKEPIAWQLHPETKIIGEYTAKKATTTYLKSEWTAWYTEAVPIAEGPYLFQGLPGLILEISDRQNYFVWTFLGLSKIPSLEPYKTMYNTLYQLNTHLKTKDLTTLLYLYNTDRMTFREQKGFYLSEEETRRRRLLEKQAKFIFLDPLINFRF